MSLLQIISQHLNPSAVSAARLACQSWKLSLDPKHVSVTIWSNQPPRPTNLAPFAAATTAAVYLGPFSYDDEDSSANKPCCQCQQMSAVTGILQQLPHLQQLKFIQLGAVQQIATNQRCITCQQCLLKFTATVQLDPPTPQQQLLPAPAPPPQHQQTQQHTVQPYEQLLTHLQQLQQLRSLTLDLPVYGCLSHLVCSGLQRLSQMTELILHVAIKPADLPDWGFSLIVESLPAQLRSLQMLSARDCLASPGSWQYRAVDALSAMSLVTLPQCKQLQQLKISLPLEIHQGHATVLRNVLALGQLTALQLPRVSWSTRQQQQQQQGQLLAAALLVPLSGTGCSSSSNHGSSALRCLQLGASIPSSTFQVVLPALQQLTTLTALQLPVQCCYPETVSALSDLKGLREIIWSSVRYSCVRLTSQLLDVMVKTWPVITSFTFENLPDLVTANSSSSGSGGGWELFQQWSQLQDLSLGSPRLPITGAVTRIKLPITHLPTSLTGLSLTNMVLDSYTTKLPCSGMLRDLSIHWPWRVNDLSVCAPPCLDSCTQLSSLKLIGCTLATDSLSKVLRQQCTQLDQLLLSYVRCPGDSTYGISQAFSIGGSSSSQIGPAAAAAAGASKLQLSRLKLECDRSDQMMALASILEYVVVPPPEAPAEAVAAAGDADLAGDGGDGSVRVLELSCKDTTLTHAKQVGIYSKHTYCMLLLLTCMSL